MRQYKTLISTVIILLIGLHAVPVLYRAERGTLWPFMQYAMYNTSSLPGVVRAQVRHAYGVTSRGERTEVTPYLLGLSITVLDFVYLRRMAFGDDSVAQALIERLNRDRKDPFVELRLESESYTVTDTGVVREDNPGVTFRVASESR